MTLSEFRDNTKLRILVPQVLEFRMRKVRWALVVELSSGKEMNHAVLVEILSIKPSLSICNPSRLARCLAHADICTPLTLSPALHPNQACSPPQLRYGPKYAREHPL